MTTKKNEFSDQRFEFTLNINNNIICKRTFNIDNYNPDVIKSYELKSLMDDLVGMDGYYKKLGIIPALLIKYSEDFLWNDYNPYAVNTNNDDKKTFVKTEDVFTFEIKVDNKVVAKSSFSGNWFPTYVRVDEKSINTTSDGTAPTYVRYKVNIREIVPQIIELITNSFTRKKYTKKYLSVQL